MAIWLTYGKGWQRPQSRHCGNAKHLVDACCSYPCHDLLKRPDQCTPSKPRNRSRGALLSLRALPRDTQLSRTKNDENRCEEPLHHAPSHGVWGIRRCAHDTCWMMINAASYWGLCHRPCPCAHGSDSAIMYTRKHWCQGVKPSTCELQTMGIIQLSRSSWAESRPTKLKFRNIAPRVACTWQPQQPLEDGGRQRLPLQKWYIRHSAQDRPHNHW